MKNINFKHDCDDDEKVHSKITTPKYLIMFWISLAPAKSPVPRTMYHISSKLHTCCVYLITTHAASYFDRKKKNSGTHPFLWCGWSHPSLFYMSGRLRCKHHSGLLWPKSRWCHRIRFSEKLRKQGNQNAHELPFGCTLFPTCPPFRDKSIRIRQYEWSNRRMLGRR